MHECVHNFKCLGILIVRQSFGTSAQVEWLTEKLRSAGGSHTVVSSSRFQAVLEASWASTSTWCHYARLDCPRHWWLYVRRSPDKRPLDKCSSGRGLQSGRLSGEHLSGGGLSSTFTCRHSVNVIHAMSTSNTNITVAWHLSFVSYHNSIIVYHKKKKFRIDSKIRCAELILEPLGLSARKLAYDPTSDGWPAPLTASALNPQTEDQGFFLA